MSFFEMKTFPILLLIHLTHGFKKNNQISSSSNKDTLVENVGPPPSPGTNIVLVGPTFYDSNLDPATGLKAPVDFLETRVIYPQTEEEKRYYLKTKPLQNIQFVRNREKPVLYYNPRDKILANMSNRTNKGIPLWINFESLQSKNINLPNRPKPVPNTRLLPRGRPLERDKLENLFTYFRDNSFSLDRPEDTVLNWTTCEQFKRRSVFHPKDVLNIDWLPFYTWSPQNNDVAVIHKFRIPSRRIVLRYKDEYDPYLSVQVDWNQPKLLMDGSKQGLLIAADQRGLFYAIMDQKVSEYVKTHPNAKYPVVKIRMKIVDPYLALMHCDDYYATIMAIKANAPATDKEKIAESKVLNFTGTGYPISIDEDMEARKAKWQSLQREREEKAKYIQLRDDDYVVENDKYLDRL